MEKPEGGQFGPRKIERENKIKEYSFDIVFTVMEGQNKVLWEAMKNPDPQEGDEHVSDLDLIHKNREEQKNIVLNRLNNLYNSKSSQFPIANVGFKFEMVDTNIPDRPASVTLRVANATNFIYYLQLLDSKEIKIPQAKGLESLFKEFKKNLIEAYIPEIDQDKNLEAVTDMMRMLPEADAEIKRIFPDGYGSIRPVMAELMEFQHAFSGGYFKEFLNTEKLEFKKMKEDQQSLYAFMSPLKFKEKWESLYKALRALKKNPEAKEIFNKYMSGCVEVFDKADEYFDKEIKKKTVHAKDLTGKAELLPLLRARFEALRKLE